MPVTEINIAQILASIAIKWGIDKVVNVSKLAYRCITKPKCLSDAFNHALKDMEKKHPGIDKKRMRNEYDVYVPELILYRISKKRGGPPKDALLDFDCEFLDLFESWINKDMAATTYLSTLVVEEFLLGGAGGNTSGPESTPAGQKQPHILTPNSVGQPTRFFFGREKELQELDGTIKEKRFVSITGAGGIGKSTLARKYLSLHRDEYDKVAWIDYSGNLEHDIVTQTGAGLGIKSGSYASRWQQISRLLANSAGSKLFIIDDVDEDHSNGEDDKLIDNLQTLTGWAGMHILLTSRERDASEVFHPQALKEFTPEESVLLFYKYLGEHRDEKDADVVADIVGMMHYHTFAIEVVAKAARTEPSLAAYRDMLKDGFGAIDDEVRIGAEKGNPACLVRALFDIQKRSKKESEVLQAFACLPQKAILVKTEIKEWFGFPYNRYSKLYESHWISMETRGYFYLLPIVRDAVRLDFKDGEAPMGTASGFVKYLGEHHDTFFDVDIDFPELKRHVDYAVSVLEAVGLNSLAVDAGFLRSIGIACHTVFRLHNSLYFLDKALQLALARNESNSVEVVGAMWDQASTLTEFQEQKALQTAVDEFSSALNEASGLLGPDSKVAGHLHNELGLACHFLRQKETLIEAEKHFKASIDIFGKAKDISNQSASINNLANVYLDMGGAKNVQEAIKLCKQDLKLTVEHFGEDSAKLSPTYHTLAYCHLRLGSTSDLDKAIHYFKEDIEIAKKHYKGESHPEIATSYDSIANAYRQRGKRGDLGKARSYYQKAIDILKDYEEKKYDIAIVYNNMANCYQDMGHKHLKDAKECLENAKDFLLKAYPDELCSDIPVLYTNLATVYKNMGGKKNLDAAFDYYRRSIDLAQRIWGEDDTEVAYFMNGLGNAYYVAGRSDKSIPVFEQAINILEADPAENRDLLACLYTNIGNAYAEQNTEESFRTAITYFQKDIGITQEDHGKDYPGLAASYNNVAMAYKSLPGTDDKKKAAAFLEEAIRIVQDNAELIEDLALYYFNIAGIYGDLHRREQANTHYEKALEIYESILNDNDCILATVYNNYALFLSSGDKVKSADLKEAERLMRKAVSIWENQLGEDSQPTILAYQNLVSILEQKHDKHSHEDIKYYNEKISALYESTDRKG